MTDSRITWLHISDLHQGQKGHSDLWPHFSHSALVDMQQLAGEHGPPDLILFTGDLSYSGHPDEFSKVDATLARIREAVGGNPIVVPVPGNHDLKRPSAGHPAFIGFANYRQHTALRQGVLAGKDEYIDPLRQIFQGYTQWWERSVISDWESRGWAFQRGLLPGDFLLSVEIRGIRLGLAGLNSAFLQQRAGKCKGELVIELPQAGADLPTWAEGHHTALLLMHHPPAWLDDESHSDLRSFIYPSDRFAACFFGHMHGTRDLEESGQPKRWIQGASLLGLEHYGESGEVRRCGYSWGWIERAADGSRHARMRIRPRRFEITDGGDPVFFDPPRTTGPIEYDLELREIGILHRPASATSVRVDAVWKEIARRDIADELIRA